MTTAAPTAAFVETIVRELIDRGTDKFLSDLPPSDSMDVDLPSPSPSPPPPKPPASPSLASVESPSPPPPKPPASPLSVDSPPPPRPKPFDSPSPTPVESPPPLPPAAPTLANVLRISKSLKLKISLAGSVPIDGVPTFSNDNRGVWTKIVVQLESEPQFDDNIFAMTTLHAAMRELCDQSYNVDSKPTFEFAFHTLADGERKTITVKKPLQLTSLYASIANGARRLISAPSFKADQLEHGDCHPSLRRVCPGQVSGLGTMLFKQPEQFVAWVHPNVCVPTRKASGDEFENTSFKLSARLVYPGVHVKRLGKFTAEQLAMHNALKSVLVYSDVFSIKPGPTVRWHRKRKAAI